MRFGVFVALHALVLAPPVLAEPPLTLTVMLRTPDDEPLAGASIVLAEPSTQVRISDNEFEPSECVDIQTTGDDGVVEFPAPNGLATLIAIHPEGYIERAVPAGTRSLLVKAQHWARLEGNLQWGGTPASGVPVDLTSLRPADRPFINHLQRAKTDDRGAFLFDRVPPGSCQVSQFVKGYLAACDRVTIEPGQTGIAMLGGQGLPIVGRIELSADVATAAGEMPKIGLHIFPRPPSISGDRDTVDEAYRRYREFSNSAHGKFFRRNDVAIDADGEFRVEGLPPGQYVAQIRVSSHHQDLRLGGQLAGFVAKRFEVFSPRNAQPGETTDVGVLVPLPKSVVH